MHIGRRITLLDYSKRRLLVVLLVMLFVCSVSLLSWDKRTNSSDNFDTKTEAWFRQMARECPKVPSLSQLYKCSGWEYLPSEHYNDMMLQGAFLMDPPIKDGDSIADIGMGTGAPFASLLSFFPNLLLHGVDLSADAISTAQRVFPAHAANFYTGNMTIRNETTLPTNKFDHVASFGALAMYLTVDNMVVAMKEAVRATKPGGSLLFTHFWPPGSTMRGTIRSPVDASFWPTISDELGVTNVRAHCMIHQGDRYMITMRKKLSPDEPTVNPVQTWPVQSTTTTRHRLLPFLTVTADCGVNNCRCATHSKVKKA